MDNITINRRQLDLLLNAITKAHWQMEEDGLSGSDDWRSLRALEDRLGTLQGDKFLIQATR